MKTTRLATRFAPITFVVFLALVGAAAALVDTTLFDRDASGATSILSSDELFSYSNNRIVGAPGFGFTSTTPLQ